MQEIQVEPVEPIPQLLFYFMPKMQACGCSKARCVIHFYMNIVTQLKQIMVHGTKQVRCVSTTVVLKKLQPIFQIRCDNHILVCLPMQKNDWHDLCTMQTSPLILIFKSCNMTFTFNNSASDQVQNFITTCNPCIVDIA